MIRLAFGVHDLRHLSSVVRLLSMGSILFLLPQAAMSQGTLECGGFVDQSVRFYVKRPNTADTLSTATGHLHFWTRGPLGSRLSWRSSVDFRLDTHHDTDRRRWADLEQRGLRQPAGSLAELYLDARLGRLDLRLGKQEIRWGRADGFNPTDNLIPYDYLNTFVDRRIAVPALKADLYFGKSRLEGAWIPLFTPTRLPLLNQRWFPRLPQSAILPLVSGGDPVQVGLEYRDGRTLFPARTFGNGQWGARWNQIVPRAEFSFSYFDGFDDIPFFRAFAAPVPANQRLLVDLNREHHRVRIAGMDFASGLGPFGIRGEAAYFDRTDPDNRDHLLFVVGLDRSWGDWFLILQYTGQRVSALSGDGAVFPDLGFRSTAIFRLERNLGPSRSMEVKGAVRLRDGDLMLQPLYSVALSNKWRLKIGAVLLAGPRNGFLGQYRESSNLNIELRYSF